MMDDIVVLLCGIGLISFFSLFMYCWIVDMIHIYKEMFRVISRNIDLDKMIGKKSDEKLRQGNTKSTIDSGGIRSDSTNS